MIADSDSFIGYLVSRAFGFYLFPVFGFYLFPALDFLCLYSCSITRGLFFVIDESVLVCWTADMIGRKISPYPN